MTDILCDEVNCIWYKNEECDAGKIVCSCDGCRTFQDYMDLPEYQCEYWEAIVRKSKKDIVRKRRKGKEVMEILHARQYEMGRTMHLSD